MKRIICIVTSLLLIIPAYSGYAQNKRVRNITGRCEITRDISLSQAEQKALEDAKINAKIEGLSKAAAEAVKAAEEAEAKVNQERAEAIAKKKAEAEEAARAAAEAAAAEKAAQEAAAAEAEGAQAEAPAEA